MGKIKKILENELIGGTQSTDIYPVTSIKAVYDENNERLDYIINKKIETDRLANGAVTTDKIAQGAITTEKIAQGAVTVEKLDSNAISDYDVSAHNDDAVFESISALLSSPDLNTLIPTSIRHGGMSIRFIQGSVPNSDNKYVQYRLATSIWSTDIHDWTSEDPYFIDKIIQEVNEAIDENTPIEITGDVTNAPDEEDLTSVNVGGTDVLKFKDKAYNPLTYSGMGRIILRKNIVDGVNTLIQSMINQANTIYVIQYDFTLGEDITIPTNCILKFDGGSVSGEHTITGQNTGINAGLVKVFNTDITLAGSWNVAEAYPEWFGAKGDGVTDDTLQCNKLNTVPFKVIKFINTYKVSHTSKTTCLSFSNKIIKANRAIFKAEWPSIVFNLGDNVDFSGGHVEYSSFGKKVLYDNAYIASINSKNVFVHDIIQVDASHTVYLKFCKNSLVSNITCKHENLTLENTGSHILLFGCSKCIVENCFLYGGTGDGDLSLYTGNDNIVRNNYVSSYREDGQLLSGLAQGICIDAGCHNILVEGNHVVGYYYGIDAKSSLAGIIISNNKVGKCKYGIVSRLGELNQVTSTTEIVNNLIYDPLATIDSEITRGVNTVGVYIEGTTSASIKNNQITRTSPGTSYCIGIYINNNINEPTYSSIEIIGNKISFMRYLGGNHNMFGDGIYIIGNTPCNIFDNSIYSDLNNDKASYYFIYLNGTSGAINIGNNNFYGKYSGIKCDNCNFVSINNNIITGVYTGITTTNGGNFIISNNNIIMDTQYQYSIKLVSFDKAILNSNYIIESTNLGEGVYGTGNHLILTSNYLKSRHTLRITGTTQEKANNIEDIIS